jgi:aminoglycoside phosphotransferase (APT) family kinase protein
MNNSLFRVQVAGETYACKLFVVDERRRAYREWAALNQVWRGGLSLAPRPVAYLPDGPLPVPAVIYGWVDGVSLTHEPLTADFLVELVNTLWRIHRVPLAPAPEVLTAFHQPSRFTDYLTEIQTNTEQIRAWVGQTNAKPQLLAHRIADLAELLPALVEALRLAEAAIGDARLDDICPADSLIRVDGNLDNILRGADKRLTFVDWEYSGLGDPAYDLAELRWHPAAWDLPGEWWDAALAAYAPLPGDSSFAQRLALFNRLLPIWWVGRNLLFLLEGAGQIAARPRLAPIPDSIYDRVRRRMAALLALLGLDRAQKVA